MQFSLPWQLVLLRWRIRQLQYVSMHPIGFWRTTQRLKAMQTDCFKYLENYLSLGMPIQDRGSALVSHYEILNQRMPGLRRAAADGGIQLWERYVADDQPPLKIMLETAGRSMEGELQLRFIFRSTLFQVTFLLSEGTPFLVEEKTVLYIGGAQGGRGCLAEVREAAKYNGEISPANTLMIVVEELVKLIGVEAMLGVSGEDHPSYYYAPSQIKLGYARLWDSAGAVKQGRYFRLPTSKPPRPLTSIPERHRARTKRKRVKKDLIRAEMHLRLSGFLR